MKKIVLVSLLLNCLLFFTSCENDDNKNENTVTIEYSKSLAIWNTLKTEKGNSYSYKVTTSSFTGFKSETIITITNGVATNRSYTSSTTKDPNTADLLTYEEDASNLGSNIDGAKPITLDQVYEICQQDLTADPAENKIIFETFDNGLLKQCGFISNACQDDCFMGITIAEIKFIK